MYCMLTSRIAQIESNAMMSSLVYRLLFLVNIANAIIKR